MFYFRTAGHYPFENYSVDATHTGILLLTLENCTQFFTRQIFSF